MASIPGGPADKLGNEFERLWTIKHLVQVVAGRATSVIVESLGDDETGAEFWVTRANGVREAHQCKRENGSSGDWSAADLNAKGVINKAKFQLDRSPSHRFVFASADKALKLADLTERSRRGDSDIVFRDDAINSTGLRSEFTNLCRYLALDPAMDSDLAKIRDFLQRFDVRSVEKNIFRSDVEYEVASWIFGDPGTVVSTLESFISRNENMGRLLTEAEILNSLPEGCRARDLGKDATLPSRLEELRRRFNRSYEHLLVDGKELNRTETNRLLVMLEAPNGPRLILIHGSGGVGKSGVIYESISRMEARGFSVLPLRLDRDKPADSPQKYGESLELPASPAACLASVAEGRIGVLILDQVDAIRWTSAHSAHAWDTCERVINEAIRHNNLRVVVVCRTFDIDDDTRFKDWKQRQKAEELRVDLLDHETLKAVVVSAGEKIEELGEKQQEVLRSPQALYLWRRLITAGEAQKKFRNMTDLMRSFWRMIRHKLSELKPGRYEELLASLVSYMDVKGTLFAPQTVIDRLHEECAALVSLNVLTESSNGKVTFAHQSYLDYLTAEKILNDMRSRKTGLFQWLKENDQSLFRRGQLRQLLALLREEDAQQYADALLDLVTAPDIRFHLQHLAMQFLGHVDEPTDAEVTLVIDLFEDPTWRSHIYQHVLTVRVPWFDKLFASGVIKRWLTEDPEHQQFALHLMRTVVAARGTEVEALLKSEDGSGWHPGTDNVMAFVAPSDLSNGLFLRYLDLAKTGSDICKFIDWKKISEANPKRAVEVLAARLTYFATTSSASDDSADAEADQGEIVRKPAVEILSRAAVACPEETWNLLIPILIKSSRKQKRLRRRKSKFSYKDFSARRKLSRITRLVRRLLVAAGKSLLRNEPEKQWERIQNLKHLRHRNIQNVLTRLVAVGPPEWSERAINWLLENPLRFRSGFSRRASRFRATSYSPARALIRRFGANCKAEKISELEAAILRYRPTNEINDYRLCHEMMMGKYASESSRGIVICKRMLFLGQYLLLCALPKDRLSPLARDWLGVLERRFGSTDSLVKESNSYIGGVVRSPIPNDKVHLVGDSQWLKIITSNWSNKEYRWRQLKPSVVVEAKPETFARDLAGISRRQPSRFADLALRFPADVDPRYVAAILQSLGETKSPQNEDPTKWRVASVHQIEAVIDRFAHLLNNRDIATAVCRVMRDRAQEDWSLRTLSLVATIAETHPHPAPGEYTVFSSRAGTSQAKVTLPDALQTSINCVRGVAADAIEVLLYGRLDRLPIFHGAIESLVQDTHPAVRISATGIAIPMLDGDRDAAITLFLRACDISDDAVLLGNEVGRFLSYTLLDYHARLRPLVERMISSNDDLVAQAGAGWVTSFWANTMQFQDLLDRCVSGRKCLRHGVAEVLPREINRNHGGGEALRLLGALFNDSEKEVRGAAASVFRYDMILAGPVAMQLAKQFIESAAFAENIDDVLYGLKGATVSMVPYAPLLAAVVKRLKESAEARNVSLAVHVHTGLLAELLLRLYEQSEGDVRTRRECLDDWDNLLASGASSEALQRMDR